MRTSYDPEADAMFVWFGPEGVKSAETEEVAPGIVLDFADNAGWRRNPLRQPPDGDARSGSLMRVRATTVRFSNYET